MIEPFFFSDALLSGIFHPAQGVAKRRSVVIAGPLLNESMRAHHALRRMAITLAQSGIDVLRFDFEGMGNSAGNLEKVMPDDWAHNVQDAVHELVELSGEKKVSIIAVRFAACLAARVSVDINIDKLVFWDPVGSGREWSKLLQKSKIAFADRARGISSLGASEYMGHVMAADFMSSLAQFEGPPTAPNTSLIALTDKATVPGELWKESTPVRNFDFQCDWESPSSQVLIPHNIVSAICEHLS